MNLTRSDFKRKDLKGQANRWYYSFIDRYLNRELTLEPCLNGFCVGFWKLNTQDLLSKKVCTDLREMVFKAEEDYYKEHKGNLPAELCDSLRQKELMLGTLERSEKVWDKALLIANQLYRQVRNEEYLRKKKIIKDENETWGGLPPNYTTVYKSTPEGNYTYPDVSTSASCP